MRFRPLRKMHLAAAAAAALLTLSAGPAGAKVLRIYPGQMQPYPGGGHTGSPDSYVQTFAWARSYGADPAIWTYPLKLRPGTRLDRMVLHQLGSGGTGQRTSMTLWRVRLGGDEEPVNAATSSDTSGDIVQAESVFLPVHVVEKGYAYYLEFRARDGNAYIYGGEIHYRRPKRR